MRLTGFVNVHFLCGNGTLDEARWASIVASLGKCRALHGGDASGGLHADAVADAGAGRAAQPPLLLERPPSCPSAPAAETPEVLLPAMAHDDEDAEPAAVPAATALFFEVSRNTGRLHAFLPDSAGGFEHLGSVSSLQLKLARLTEAAAVLAPPFTSHAVRSAAATFLEIWDAQPPKDRNLLWQAGKPLRLPLEPSLNAARAAHKSVPSTIRSAKAIDIIPPPPAGSIGPLFIYVRHPHGDGRWEYKLYMSAKREWLCRCCNERPAREQPTGEQPTVSCLLDLCCSKACHERCVRCAAAVRSVSLVVAVQTAADYEPVVFAQGALRAGARRVPDVQA